MDKDKLDRIFFYILILFPIVIFVLTPADAVGRVSVLVNNVLDAYLFGNGYYKPDRYPFAAKVTNIFTVIFALFMGLLCTILYGKEADIVPKENRKKGYAFIFLMLVLFLWVSILPQEFSSSSGRNFGLSRSFHNNPFTFLFLIFIKQIMIYVGVRVFGGVICKLFSKSKI
ncbi:hypothetical protein ACFPVS_03230 [Neisseria weixii]|uniref:Uncharacterized protein n=1 Tax=Neisseria weixii TaxID=1853276 RepID=A0A3N4N890_9NEIS|nr:hypothetical protein [Neisseria weixii]RPD89776.1 hypothetical protein EGK74_03050 [Neisseria weixii]RPD90005.1 hypothetical protein EGK75_03050 [Neisseria weixii]